MNQQETWTYWALKLRYMGGLAGVWWFPEANPRDLNGTALFKTRQQARDAARARAPRFLGPAVRVEVRIREAG